MKTMAKYHVCNHCVNGKKHLQICLSGLVSYQDFQEMGPRIWQVSSGMPNLKLTPSKQFSTLGSSYIISLLQCRRSILLVDARQLKNGIMGSNCPHWPHCISINFGYWWSHTLCSHFSQILSRLYSFTV